MAQSSRRVKAAAAAGLGAVLALTGIALPASATALNTGAVIQPTAGTTQINLIGFNDFHGRITKVSDLAANILQVRDAFGKDNSLILGIGDQFGASEFESSVAGDKPSKDALLALGVDAIAAGNHEFDQGQTDTLAIRNMFGTLLAANVTKADGSLLLDAYKTFEVAGHTVAVIGAVTASTASGVSPSGIEGLTFGDPVAAVNSVAAQLSDGNLDNGEADVIVAAYHEGGPTSGSYEENAQNAVFREIAEQTSPEVDAIFNAHTHKVYNYEVNGRQIVQAGSYADNLAQIVLNVDASGKVVSSSSSIVPTYEADGAPRVTRDELSPASQAVYDAVDKVRVDALAQAEVLGAQKVGVVNEDITRAKTYDATGAVTEVENRSQESTLGSVVADSMMQWAKGVGTPELDADLSIMNPGGLRADILGDGTLTYKDAQTVLPFVNNLAVVSISGAELKNVFEQQWQLDADGNVPARSYLQLGISSNVDYTYTGAITDDPATTQGTHITSIYVDGQPLQADKIYKVVMPSFLAAGGDNFTALNNNEGVYDTGSVDLDAFIAYVRGLPGGELKPDNTRNGFNIAGYFDAGATPTLAAGSSKTFTLKDLDLHSLGLIPNTRVRVMLNDLEIGSAAVTGNTAAGETTNAQVTISVPATITPDTYSLALLAEPSGSIVHVPLVVTAAKSSQPGAADTANTTAASQPQAAAEANGKDGIGLASTGTDEFALFAGVAAGVLTLAAGAGLLLLRRRRA